MHVYDDHCTTPALMYCTACMDGTLPPITTVHERTLCGYCRYDQKRIFDARSATSCMLYHFRVWGTMIKAPPFLNKMKDGQWLLLRLVVIANTTECRYGKDLWIIVVCRKRPPEADCVVCIGADNALGRGVNRVADSTDRSSPSESVSFSSTLNKPVL